MEKNFVIFLSPGTFVSEQTQKPVDSWDVGEAKKMALGIAERYNAKPYGFKFVTRCRKDDELDSKVIKQSPIYYLGGTIKTLEQVKAENNPKNNILISNMEVNGYARIIENNNSWKFTAPLNDEDVVLDWPLEATV